MAAPPTRWQFRTDSVQRHPPHRDSDLSCLLWGSCTLCRAKARNGRKVDLWMVCRKSGRASMSRWFGKIVRKIIFVPWLAMSCLLIYLPWRCLPFPMALCSSVDQFYRDLCWNPWSIAEIVIVMPSRCFWTTTLISHSQYRHCTYHGWWEV